MKKYLIWIITIAWALLIWRLTTSAQIVVTDNSSLQNILMMIAHFSFFGIQALLLKLSLPLIPSITFTSLYGALIEYIQLTVPGRTSDPMDWLLDTLGAITFLLVLKKLQSKL